jgi:hypothetical protein
MTTSVLLQAHEALYTRGLIVGCLVGVLLGGTIGVFVAALCAAAGRGDDVGPRSDPVEPALLSIEQRYRRQQEAAPDVVRDLWRVALAHGEGHRAAAWVHARRCEAAAVHRIRTADGRRREAHVGGGAACVR